MAPDYFAVATDGARRYRDDVLVRRARSSEPYVQVELPWGDAIFPRCVADVYANDTLTITAYNDGRVTREYKPGAWAAAIVFDGAGQPMYAFQAMTPVDRVVVDCPVCPRQAWLVSEGPEGLKEFQCAAGHQLFSAPSAERRSA